MDKGGVVSFLVNEFMVRGHVKFFNKKNMKQNICFLILVSLVFLPIQLPKTAEADNPCSVNSQPIIFISEIGWAGSSKGTTDEWLEITNNGSTEISLGGWTIEGAASSGGVLSLSQETKISPQSVFLIANYSAESDKSVLGSPPNYITSAISLSNSTLQIIIKNETGCTIDLAGDGGAPFFGGTLDKKTVSMIRQQPVMNGDLPTSWMAAEISKGFDADATDLGTPGFIDMVGAEKIADEEILSPQETASPSNDNSAGPSEIISETQEQIIELPLEETETTTVDESIFNNENSVTVETTETPVITEDILGENIVTETSGPEPLTIPEESELKIISKEEEILAEENVILDPVIETIENVPEETEEIQEKNTASEEDDESLETLGAEETVEETNITYPEKTLLINEFVVDPIKGEKEWVEILNPGQTNISLEGWSINESSGRIVILPNQQLLPNQLVVVEFSSGALNNDADTITLFGPDNQIIDTVQYGTNNIPTANDPNSVALNEKGNFFVTTTPTKGKVNLITLVEEPPESTTEKNEKKNTASSSTKESTKKSSASEDSIKEGGLVEKTDEALISNEVDKPTTAQTPLRLSKLYPNTDGSDTTEEFIEIENTGTEAVDLFGLSLEDLAKNAWKYPEHTKLAAGQFLTISRSQYQFALNNSGSETLSLFTADGTIIDKVQYENAPKQFIYTKTEGAWQWAAISAPTESVVLSQDGAAENNDVAGQNVITSSSVSDQGTEKPESFARVSLSEARELPNDTKIIIEGIVSVVPGLLGKQIFYLQKDAGLQIYKADEIFPELAVGDRLEITGTKSSNRDEPRLKIGKDDTIIVLEKNQALAITDLTKLEGKFGGQLVRVSGLVTEKSSDRFTLETEDGFIEIRLKETADIKTTEIKPGSQLIVTGIVGQSNENFFVLPRTQEDIIFKESIVAAETTNSPINLTGKQINQQSDQNKALIIGLVTIGGLIFYALRRRQQSRHNKHKKDQQLSLVATG